MNVRVIAVGFHTQSQHSCRPAGFCRADYKVIESAPHWVSALAAAGKLRRMNRCYVLQPGPVRGGVLLRHQGEIEPNFELPPILGVVGSHSMIEPQSSAMLAQIERRAAAPGAPK